MQIFIQIRRLNHSKLIKLIKTTSLKDKKNISNIQQMKKQENVFEESESQLNSSTSSYSETMPRQDNFTQVRKDKPIVMRSIPMNKQKYPTILKPNINDVKKQSITLINSTHAYTTSSQQNISAEVYKNEDGSQRHFNSTKVIGNEEKWRQKQTILNQNLVKSTYEQYRQKQAPLDNVIQLMDKKQEQSMRQQFQNVVLDLSLSSMNSQNKPTKSPKQPFKMYLDPSPPKSQPQNNRQVKQYLDAIKEMRRQQQSRGTPIKSQSYQLQTLIKKNHELEVRLKQYEQLFKAQTQSIIMERKANQIYTDFYHTLSKMITNFIVINKHDFSFPGHQLSEPLNESLNIEKILQTVQKLISAFSIKAKPKVNFLSQQVQTQCLKTQPPNQNFLRPNQLTTKIEQLQALLQTAQNKNIQLRNELLLSTQKNINAIFNTQISASCCLQNQVAKINSEMSFLKQKMNLILLKKQPTVINHQPLPPQIIYLSQPSPPANPFNERKENNIVKIYTTKSKMRQSDDESDSISGNQNKKRRHSLSRKRKRSSKSQSQRSQSSISSKSTKKREQLSQKQIENLKQAYNQTKVELNSLIQTLSLITNSQNDMKGYFSQIKEDIIRSMNEKLKQSEEEQMKKQKIQQQRIRDLEQRQNKQRQLNHQQQVRVTLEIAQKMKIKEASYINHIESMKNQRQEDRKVIENLNQKIIQLLNAIAVPQKVKQQPQRSKLYHFNDDQIPLSQISVSVDYLHLIEQLKTQKQKQQVQIQSLNKQNTSLKDYIVELKNVQQRARVINNNDSPNSSNQEKESIINQLNGFTEIYIPNSVLMVTTGQNYHINETKSKKTIKSNKHVTFNNISSSIAGRLLPNADRIESQKLVRLHTNSQKNIQNNFKVILQSKQTQIKSLQQQITNLEQTIEYLKRQINSKQKVVNQLENYVANLQKKSLSSISLSSPIVNLPQPNLYIDPMNSQDHIRQKYENYVKNLKLLLKETRNQNHILKQQLQNFETQVDQRTQSNFHMKNSATHSQRTTKNFPNSPPVHTHHKTSAQFGIWKRTDNTQKHQNERQQQRINSLAYENELPEGIQNIKTKGKFPSFD